MLKTAVVWGTVGACCLAGCLHIGTVSPPVQTTKLPSGTLIEIIGVQRIVFSGDSPCLMLRYRTGKKLDDNQGLGKEVGEVWNIFRMDADQAGVTNAIIRVENPSTGNSLVMHTKVRNFLFKKVRGQWTRLRS